MKAGLRVRWTSPPAAAHTGVGHENASSRTIRPANIRLGLGCMGMSDAYGPADETESIATIHAALDAGITLLDTGDFYGMGHNEMLLARALKGVPRDRCSAQCKFGAQRSPDSQFLGFDAEPEHGRRPRLAYSLKRLNTDYIDIYRPARLDPRCRSKTPLAPSPTW